MSNFTLVFRNPGPAAMWFLHVRYNINEKEFLNMLFEEEEIPAVKESLNRFVFADVVVSNRIPEVYKDSPVSIPALVVYMFSDTESNRWENTKYRLAVDYLLAEKYGFDTVKELSEKHATYTLESMILAKAWGVKNHKFNPKIYPRQKEDLATIKEYFTLKEITEYFKSFKPEEVFHMMKKKAFKEIELTINPHYMEI